MTLRERISEGKLGCEEAAGIALQCTAALTAAHSAGIVHRDIKPENIMVKPDGMVKIVDFGLARMVEARPDWSLDVTLSGTVMGTPRYMSPEQARGEKPDAQSDIFSLGAVLFELIAGRPAFPGKTLAMEEFANGLGSFDRNDAGPLAARRWGTLQNRLFRTRAGRAAPAIALLALVGLGIYAWTGFRSAPPEQALNLIPLTASGGNKKHLALSPDGTRVAFIWAPPGTKTHHLYVMTIGQSEPVQLTASAQSDSQPAWSPDGTSIAFCRPRNVADREHVPEDIYVIRADGGNERKVAEGWDGVSWSPDGKTLALAHVPSQAPDGKSGGIFLLSLESGERREVTRYRDRLPLFSPDGKWIAFVRATSEMASEAFVIRAEGGRAQQLTSDGQQARGMMWTADSRELVFASSRRGADGSLWRIPVSGGRPRPISVTLIDAFDETLSIRLSHNMHTGWPTERTGSTQIFTCARTSACWVRRLHGSGLPYRSSIGRARITALRFPPTENKSPSFPTGPGTRRFGFHAAMEAGPFR
jgi:hypothetical protein